MGREAEEFLEGVIIYYIVCCLAQLIRINLLVNTATDLYSMLSYLQRQVCQADQLCKGGYTLVTLPRIVTP
jgi:hypothetical protein